MVLQAWDFQQGQNFVLAMDSASQAAGRTLVVLSPDFLASRFTAPEWAAAFAKDPTGQRGLLLPVRVKSCNPDGLLGQIVYIDLMGAQTKDEARQRLLAGVDQARRKPETEPNLPALAPDPRHRPSVPEPAWVADLEAVIEVAVSALWRVLRVLAAEGQLALASWPWPAWPPPANRRSRTSRPPGGPNTGRTQNGAILRRQRPTSATWPSPHRP